jgi:hypothetical protein
MNKQIFVFFISKDAFEAKVCKDIDVLGVHHTKIQFFRKKRNYLPYAGMCALREGHGANPLGLCEAPKR